MQYVNSLDWPGVYQWKRTPKQVWTSYGNVYGWSKISGNLWFVLVNNAGHFVPYDQPDAAIAMLKHFLYN